MTLVRFDSCESSREICPTLRHALDEGCGCVSKAVSETAGKHGIEHPEEKVIHQQLSPNQDATTRSKSFFLKQNVNLTRIDRGEAVGGSTVPLTCVSHNNAFHKTHWTY